MKITIIGATGGTGKEAVIPALEQEYEVATYVRSPEKWEFSQTMLAIHLLNHEGTATAKEESRVDHLWEHLRWQPHFAEKVIRYAERKGMVRRQSGHLRLTTEGRALAQQTLVH